MTLPNKGIKVPSLVASIGVLAAAVTAPVHATTTAILPIATQDGGQQDAQYYIDEGNRALEESRYRDAVNHFQRALQLSGGNAEAAAGLSRARTMLNQGSTLESESQDIELRRAQLVREFDASMQNARQLLEQQQFDRAQNTVVAAQVRLQTNRTLLSESQYQQRLTQSESLLTEIQQAEEAFRLQQAQSEQQQLEAQKAAEQAEELRRRQQQIEQNLIRVRELQLELKYEEALQVLDQTLFIDPHNAVALALRDAIETALLWRSFLDTEKVREESYSWQFSDNRAAAIAPVPNFSGPGPRSTTGIVTYPEDWPQISVMRTTGAGAYQTVQNRRVAAALDNTLISHVQMQNNTLEQALQYLEETTGSNVVADWKSLALINVTPDDPVNLNLRNVSAKVLLERTLDQLGDEIEQPAYAIQDGLLVVASEDAIKEHVVTLVYDIRDLLFEVPYFDNAPTLDLSKELNGTPPAPSRDIFQGGNGNQADVDSDALGDRSARDSGLFSAGGGSAKHPTRESRVSDLVSLIESHVDRDSWQDFGGDTGAIQELSGNLVITQTPRNHRAIQGLLSQLREIRALQINIESRFLTVDMNWFEKIGFDLDLFFNTNSDLLQQARAVDPLFQLGDFFDQRGRLKDPVVFTGINQAIDPQGNPPTNTVAFGNSFGIPDATNTNIIYNVGPVGPPIRTTDGFSPFGISQDSFNLVDLLGGFAADSFAGTILSQNPAVSLGISFLDDIQVDLLVEATQADRRNVVLTAPRLSLFNGQRSWVLVGTQQAIVTSLIPVVGDSSGAFQPITDTLTDGVVLDVEAVISADRRYVTMTIVTGVRETVAIETLEFGGAAGGGGNIGGGGGGNAATFNGSISLPEVEVSLVNTSTSVPDRGTILIGGQRLVREVEVESGVPVLSKIPFINRFFTNRVTSKDESTLLILVRPEIIIQQENEDLLFPGLSDMIGSSF